jgi:hypothetical protein
MMHLKKKFTIGSVITTAALIVLLGSAPAASAAPMSAQVCSDAGTHYVVSAKQNDVHIPTGFDWKSGPGGSVTSSVESTQTATIGVSISGTVSTSAIVASASATFGVSASVSASIGSTYAFTHAITAGKYGHMQFGNWGWRMNLNRYVVDSNCNVTSSVNGVVTKLPSVGSWGFRYWETAS